MQGVMVVVMKVMIALLFGHMLAVMLVCPVRRIRVVDHVDADARLTSPDLSDAALERLIRGIILIPADFSADAVVRACHLLLLLLVSIVVSILQRQVGLVYVGVEVDRLEVDVRADRCDRRCWIKFYQGGLQLESIHVSRALLYR